MKPLAVIALNVVVVGIALLAHDVVRGEPRSCAVGADDAAFVPPNLAPRSEALLSSGK